jgi:uncharacterized repeat protein (TIGR01451 family)
MRIDLWGRITGPAKLQNNRHTTLAEPSLGANLPCFPECCEPWNCDQANIIVGNIYTTGYDPCAGGSQNVQIKVDIRNNGASDRYCLFLWATLVNLDDETKNIEIKGLVNGGDIIPTGTSSYTLFNVDWAPGDNYRFDIHLITVSTSRPGRGETCSDTLDCTRDSSHCGKGYSLPLRSDTPAIVIDKSIESIKDPSGNTVSNPYVGDIITYKYVATNVGSLPLSGLVVTDIRGPLPGIETTIPMSATYLPVTTPPNPPSTATGYYAYTVTANDICSDIINTAKSIAYANYCGGVKPVTDISNTVTVVPTKPTLTITGPDPAQVCNSGEVSFSVSVTQSAPFETWPFTYLWEVSSDGGSSWQPIIINQGPPIEYATSNPYIFIAHTEDNNKLYRVQVTGKCGTKASNSALLTILSTPVGTITNVQ